MTGPSANAASAASDNTYAPTTVIAEHYRVERELGRGGMATVYLCTDLRTDAKVALKVLRQELGSAVIIERFLREIAFASELDHPQIPKVFESGVIDGLPYYVMTYVDGESLKKRIEREKQLPIPDALRIGCAIVEPTTYAHKKGIIHRDIKPDNILIGKDNVYVLDFGISRAIIESGGDRITTTGVGVGTPAYMSPEQALGDRNLDTRSDVYSLGCVVYEMIAGLPPFVGPTAQVIISRRFAAPPPPLSEVRDGVPEDLEDAVMKALAKSPSDRWQTAADFGKALSACATDPTIADTGWRRYGRARRARRAWIGVLGAGVVAASAFAWSAAYRDPVSSAHRALATWDLAKAEQNFRRAVDSRGDATSQLWLGQMMMLSGEPPENWKPSVQRASADRSALSKTDRVRADALLAFASEKFATACLAFRSLASDSTLAADELNVSTLAYADCVRSDSVVVDDPKSPTGYSFRSSYQLADSIYEGMLERSDSSSSAYATIIPRLERVLVAQKGILRVGHLENSEGHFLAMPSIDADTLLYIPSPLPSSGPWTPVNAAGVPRAIAANRAKLRQLGAHWTTIAPSDPRSHEFLAKILEANGELSDTAVSALSELTKARSLAAKLDKGDAESRFRDLRLANSLARVYLKLYSFDRAAALADTILGAPVPTGFAELRQDSVMGMLNGLAALRGRVQTVIDLSHRFASNESLNLRAGGTYTLPEVLSRDLIDFTTYAAFGGPKDSLIATMERLKRNIAALVPAEQTEAVNESIFGRNLRIAAPTLGAKLVANELSNENEPIVRALKIAAEGRKDAARNLLDSISNSRIGFAPGEVTLDVVYPEAWLRAEIGDVAGAARQLDNALRGLPAARANIVFDAANAAALIHAMELRARLATMLNDPQTANRWSTAVKQLWGDRPVN